jgi:hypothetical protein
MKFRGDGCSLVGGGRFGILLKVGEGDKVVSDKLKRREGQRSTRHEEGGGGVTGSMGGGSALTNYVKGE